MNFRNRMRPFLFTWARETHFPHKHSQAKDPPFLDPTSSISHNCPRHSQLPLCSPLLRPLQTNTAIPRTHNHHHHNHPQKNATALTRFHSMSQRETGSGVDVFFILGRVAESYDKEIEGNWGCRKRVFLWVWEWRKKTKHNVRKKKEGREEWVVGGACMYGGWFGVALNLA